MSTIDKLKTLVTKTDTKGTNWTAVLVWGVLLGLGIFTLWYFKVAPVYGWMCSITAWAGSVIRDLTNGIDFGNLGSQISQYITNNPLVAITGLIGVSGGLLALYERSQRVRETNLKLKADEARLYAESQASTVTEDYVMAKQKVASLESELTQFKETNVAQQLETAKSEVSKLSATVDAQKRQMQELIDKLASTPVKVVEVVK